MFQCDKCKKFEMKYDYSKKTFICSKCGSEKVIKAKKSTCSCGKEYNEYTWFDPSGCPKCNKSFIE